MPDTGACSVSPDIPRHQRKTRPIAFVPLLAAPAAGSDRLAIPAAHGRDREKTHS